MTEQIGFIGLGIMGKPMAKNLLKAGYSVTVFDVVGERVEELVLDGASARGSSYEVASVTDKIITMLPDSAQAAIQRGVERALQGALPRPPAVTRPVSVELEYSTAIYAEVAEGIPGVRRQGYSTVRFSTPDYPAAYRMIRILYRHLQP